MTAFLRDWSRHNSGSPAPINHPCLPPLVGSRLRGMGSRTLEASMSTPPVTQPPPSSPHTPHFPSHIPSPPPNTARSLLSRHHQNCSCGFFFKVTLAVEVVKSIGNFELLFFLTSQESVTFDYSLL